MPPSAPWFESVLSFPCSAASFSLPPPSLLPFRSADGAHACVKSSFPHPAFVFFSSLRLFHHAFSISFVPLPVLVVDLDCISPLPPPPPFFPIVLCPSCSPSPQLLWMSVFSPALPPATRSAFAITCEVLTVAASLAKHFEKDDEEIRTPKKTKEMRGTTFGVEHALCSDQATAPSVFDCRGAFLSFFVASPQSLCTGLSLTPLVSIPHHGRFSAVSSRSSRFR